MEECDLRIRRNAVLLQDIHLYQGGLTHAHWRLPCQDCPQLRSAAFPRCNTLKHKKTYTPIPTTIPKSLLEHVLLPLILQRGLGLVGRIDGPSRNGRGRKGEGQRARDPPLTCRCHPDCPHPIYSPFKPNYDGTDP